MIVFKGGIYVFLETERLRIRSFTQQDADALYEICYDPQVLEYCPDLLEVDVTMEQVKDFIHRFVEIEAAGDTDTWRMYAIESKETGEVMGCLTNSKNAMLHEYELGWMMIGKYTQKGYASEAATAFAEYFCEKQGVDYMIVVMDVDNPASRRVAEKSGFKLFEKRTVYDYYYNRYCDDYFYFRRYWSGCTLKDRFYGDRGAYEGRQ